MRELESFHSHPPIHVSYHILSSNFCRYIHSAAYGSCAVYSRDVWGTVIASRGFHHVTSLSRSPHLPG
jgi:hypothetical protein